MSRYFTRLLFAALCCGPAISHAYDPSWPSVSDLPLLPPYCKAKLFDTADSPEYAKWEATLGAGFEHTHHYCAGVNFVNRANKTFGNKSEQAQLLIQALNEFNYVIKHAPATYVLIPEIHVQKGRVLVRLKKNAEAIQEFHRAIELNADYVAGYTALSDQYKDMGSPGEAKQVLQKGLARLPDSKALLRRLNEVDVKSKK